MITEWMVHISGSLDGSSQTLACVINYLDHA